MTLASLSKPKQNEQQYVSTLLNGAMGLRFLIGLNLSWIGPLIPTIASAQKASLVEAGILVSIYYVGAIPMLVCGRWFLAKIGLKSSLLLASLLATLGLLMVAFGMGMPVLWAGSILFGTGAGLAIISGTVFVLKCGVDNPASLLNKLAMFYGIGALTGPVLAWGCTATPWSYHLVYLFGAVYAALLGVLMYSRARGRPVSLNASTQKNGVSHKAPDVWLFSLLLLLYIGVEIGITAWIYTYLAKATGLAHGHSALGVSFLCGGLTLGRFLGIYLCRKFQTHLITLLSMILTSTCIIALCVFPSIDVFALGLAAILGIGLGPIYPNVLASVNQKHPGEEETVTPIIVSVSFSGGIIMPCLIAYVFEHVGLQEGMAIIAGTSVFVILMYLVLYKIFLLPKNSRAEV